MKPITPKKSLGQNFLVNSRIQERIIAACDLQTDETVLEIGPGKGALTQKIIEQVKLVLAIEKDKRCVDHLCGQMEGKSIEIVHADILAYPFESLQPKTKIIGNLPYNIATPIIEKFLKHRKRFSAFYMTVQLEYGQRMAAKPNAKKAKVYGAFSCFVQYYADVKMLFKIKNTAFHPVPKVESCFLKLTPREPQWKAENEEFLFRLIRTCFSQRRKTILNSLSSIVDKKTMKPVLGKLQIHPTLRAENLSLEKFVHLANALV